MIIKSPFQQMSYEHASAPIMHPLKIEDGSNMVGDLSLDALTHVHGNHLMGVKSSIQQLPYMHMSVPNMSSFEFEDACDMGGDIMHSRTFPQKHAKYYMTLKSPIQQLSHVQTSSPYMCPQEKSMMEELIAFLMKNIVHTHAQGAKKCFQYHKHLQVIS